MVYRKQCKKTLKCIALTKCIVPTTKKKLSLKLENFLVSTSNFKTLLGIEIHHEVFIDLHVQTL